MIYGFKHFDAFMAFVVERHRIYERRARGQERPWTKDPILQQYKFTNVYRELDRVTVWIKEHWREPHKDNEHLWFAMVVARLINNPDTLAELSLPGKWNGSQFLRVMARRRREGKKMFGGAYIISTNGISQDKSVYLADSVFGPLWEARKMVAPREKDSLFQFAARLRIYQGMGSFIAAQVVADMKYTPTLINASDWWTFALSGPGSRRGMSYLMGMDPRTKWQEHEWKDALDELSVLVKDRTDHAKMPRLHNQDLQNGLCEWSKFRRTQLGTGRPKQRFVPFNEEN